MQYDKSIRVETGSTSPAFPGLLATALDRRRFDRGDRPVSALRLGVMRENARLKDRTYLLGVWRRCITAEEKPECKIDLYQSYGHLGDALLEIDRLVANCGVGSLHGGHFSRIRFPNVNQTGSARMLHERFVTMFTNDCIPTEWCFRVLGPFSGNVLSWELLSALRSSSDMLREHFIAKGM